MTHEQGVLLALVTYKSLLILIGILARRRTRDGLDYFLGGRKLGPVVAAVSASASSSSAWTLLGVSGAAYAWGLSAIWIFPACVGGFLINWLFLAPRLQKLSHETGAVTVTEVLASAAPPPGRRAVSAVASFIVLVSLTTYVASQFQGAGKSFGETFGLTPETSILLGSAVVIIYTLLGGFWAVSLTDTLQGLVMAASAVLLPVAALVRVGGPGGLWNAAAENLPDSYFSLSGDLPLAAALGFVLGILGIGLGYPGQPHVVNRFMALRAGQNSLRTAQVIAIVWAVVVYSGMLVLGWCGRVLFPQVADREVIFISATHELFPSLVAGILLAAVLSAIMSTADSQLLVAASAVTYDLRLGGGTASSLLRRSRLVVLLLSGAAVAAALFGSQEIFSPVLFAWTSMGAAFGPPLVVLLVRGGRLPARRILFAMLVGFTLSALAYGFPETRATVVERVVPFAASLAVCLWPARR